MRSQTLPFTGANSRHSRKPAIAFESSRMLGGFSTDESFAESSKAPAHAAQDWSLPPGPVVPIRRIERFD